MLRLPCRRVETSDMGVDGLPVARQDVQNAMRSYRPRASKSLCSEALQLLCVGVSELSQFARCGSICKDQTLQAE